MAKSDNGDVNNRSPPSTSSDPNNSFMKKVTSKVSGLLPSSISKWFGESDRTRQVIRRREHDDDDDQDESSESGSGEPHMSVQPPRKRARNMLPAPCLSDTYMGLGNFTMTTQMSTNEPGPSGYVRARPQYGQLDTTVQVHMNGDDRSDSGESSGYSSVPLPQHLSEPSQDKEIKPTSDINPARKLNKSPEVTALSETVSTPVRSLFSAEGLSPSPSRACMSARRPSFNASTFGSPGFVDRTLSTCRAINSPFYSGRTMYGGAAAYQRSRLAIQQNKPSIQIRPQPPAESQRSHTNHLSKTAQRILDALESFHNTTVADAKKIPPVTNKRPTNKTKIPRKELQVPTVPDLLKMKERIQNSTVAVRNTATHSKSILNTEYSLPTEDKQKHSNKIKSKITSTRGKLQYDVTEEVKLPEIHLPITTLPKFDFSLPPPASISVSPKKTEEKLPETQESQFKFSSPISVNGAPKTVISINNFKFSQPLDAKTQTQPTQVNVGFKYVPPTNIVPKKKEIPKNNGQSSELSIHPAQKLLTGSVMDILGKKESKNDLMEKFKPASGTWECSACMVRNIPSATRCVACETLKEPPKKVENKTDNSFASQFKMSADKWECGVCMVRNDNKETKCVACTTPKPGAAVSIPPVTPLSSWGDKFKPANDTWECGVCCVRNKSTVIKCVACETPKPGSKPDNTLKIPDSDQSGFSDLIKKQNERWECQTCLVRNPNTTTVCTSCGTSKPGASIKSDATLFKFGLDKTESTRLGVSGSKANTSGFQFGVPTTSNSNNTPTGFQFGVTSTTKCTEFSFGLKAAEGKTDLTQKTPTSGFTFGVQPKKEDVIVIDDDSDEKTPKEDEIKEIKTATSTTAQVSKSTTPSFTFSTSNTIPAPFQTPKESLFGSKQDSNPSFTFGPTSTTPIADAQKISFDIPEKKVESTKAPMFLFSPAVTTSTTNLVTSAPTVTVSTSSTFNFGAKPVEKTENKMLEAENPSNIANTFQVPLFNFGGNLPFNPKTESISTVTTAAPTFNFGGNASSFSTPKPSFGMGAANKAEVKPFSFGSEPPAKQQAFSFKENTKPLFNFSANNNSSSDMFSFNSKSEAKLAPAPALGTVPDVVSTTGMFGTAVQAPPQNGGFNFGATAATAPSFKFGSSVPTTQQNAPVFSFGQSGSASTPAQMPGTFAFGAAPSNTFSPDVRPNFNFTSGATPTFTAQGTGSSTAAPVRKIRKAVRRVQPR